MSSGGRMLLLLAMTVGTATATHEQGSWVERTDVSFTAAIPCITACPSWTESVTDGSHAPCRPHPTTVPGSWDDRRMTIPDDVAGARPSSLRFVIHSEVDFDSFICRVLHPGSPAERWEEAARGATLLCGGCGHCSEVGTVEVIGCMEIATIGVAPGEVYVLRVFNWSDPTGRVDGWFDWRTRAAS